jgi:glycerophosphoryl diester phosphodiesterase
LAEFKRLEGRMDASNPMASTLSEFLDATPSWRTDLYANGGTLVSHKESIELFRTHGVGMTPELKEPLVEMPFSTGKLTPHPSALGYDQAAFARQLVDVYRDAKVSPHKVALQSFNQDDIRTWLEIAPEYGARAVWLSDHDPGLPPPSQAEFEAFFAEGFRTIAPPISALLLLGPDGDFRSTEFAQNARAAGLEIIAWTAERSGRIRNGRVEAQPGDFYLGPVQSALMNDGDIYRVIDALAHEVGVKAIFSDWPATVTFYANCFGLD